jgi:ribosomal protein S18 acetylase RimI-like enzyme
MLIRQYLPRDEERMWQLHLEGLASVDADPGRGSWEDDLRDIPGHYFEAGGDFLVGEVDGLVVATGSVERLEPGRGEIRRMRVDLPYHRRGYGQQILRALEARALELGLRELELETTTLQVAAMGLYEAEGYTEIGRRAVEARGRTFHVVKLWKRLEGR